MRRTRTRSFSDHEISLLVNTFKQARYLRQRAVRFMRRKHEGWGNGSFRKFVFARFYQPTTIPVMLVNWEELPPQYRPYQSIIDAVWPAV